MSDCPPGCRVNLNIIKIRYDFREILEIELDFTRLKILILWEDIDANMREGLRNRSGHAGSFRFSGYRPKLLKHFVFTETAAPKSRMMLLPKQAISFLKKCNRFVMTLQESLQLSTQGFSSLSQIKSINFSCYYQVFVTCSSLTKNSMQVIQISFVTFSPFQRGILEAFHCE